MSVRVLEPVVDHECCVCWRRETARWPELRKTGWSSYYAGYGVDPVVLCGPCDKHMADRRAAVA